MAVTTDLREAEEALNALRNARATLELLRNVQLSVRAAWQQMGELPEDAVADLKQRLQDTAAAWAAELGLDAPPAWDVKVQQYGADLMSLEFNLPVLWPREG